MRAHHALAVVAVMLIGFGMKLLFFSAPAAEADTQAVSHDSINVIQMHIDHPNKNNMPTQKMHDMTFIFSDND